MTDVVLNTPHAREMLRKRFPSPEWALMEEVAPNTGGGTRYADAVAVNLWRSRGHAIHGVEIKISRGDWLRELKQPAKAEGVYVYCDHWWIVAPAGVVHEGELPPTWGLLELRATSLVQKTAAPRLEPKPIGRAFFASLMRRGHENIAAIAGRVHMEEVAKVRASIEDKVRTRVEDATRELRELKEQMLAFELATGLTFTRYSGPPIATVKLAQRLAQLSGWGEDKALGRLTGIADDLSKVETTLRKIVADTELVDTGVAPEATA